MQASGRKRPLSPAIASPRDADREKRTIDPQDIRLDGRTIVVAGAGGDGIGTACSVLAARAGATVVAVDRTPVGLASAEQALRAAGAQAYRVVDADLTDAGAVERLFADIDARGERLHGAINVVGGIGGFENFAPLVARDAPAIFDRVLERNLKASLLVATEAARRLMAARRGGSIVQIASTTGQISMPYGAAYAAAKAALVNLTRTMAVEWGEQGIRANAIAVGIVRTARSRETVAEVDAAARAAIPLRRLGNPDEIAGAALFLLSDLSSYVTGAVLNVDGGSMSRAPYNDATELPVFVNDPALRVRLFGN